MTILSNYEHFVSSFEANVFSALNVIGILLIAIISSILYFIVDANNLVLIIIAVMLIMQLISCIAFLSKSRKHIFLLIGSSSIVFSFSMLLNSIYLLCGDGRNDKTTVVVMTSLCVILPSIICCFYTLIKIRTGYYNDVRKNNLYDNSITIGSIGIIAVGIVIGEKLLPLTNDGFQMIFFTVFLGLLAAVCVYKGIEHLLRHYYIYKYRLEHCIRVKDNNEDRLN